MNLAFAHLFVECNDAQLPCEDKRVERISCVRPSRYIFKGATMVAIQFEYQGDLHCKAVHSPSGTELNTDAPKDNQGRGESFSPTDLVATALGTCMLTLMGIMARTLNIDIAGTTATVEKETTDAPPRIKLVKIRENIMLTDQTLTYMISSCHGRGVTRNEARFWTRRRGSSSHRA